MYFGIVALDDVDVLVHRVGRALVPLRLGHALAGRQDVEALVAFGAEEVPAALQMADQAVRLVLRRDADAADAGIERVRQREIDDARLAAEIHRGLGAAVGQLHQPAAAPAGQHIGHRMAGQRSVDTVTHKASQFVAEIPVGGTPRRAAVCSDRQCCIAIVAEAARPCNAAVTDKRHEKHTIMKIQWSIKPFSGFQRAPRQSAHRQQAYPLPR